MKNAPRATHEKKIQWMQKHKEEIIKLAWPYLERVQEGISWFDYNITNRYWADQVFSHTFHRLMVSRRTSLRNTFKHLAGACHNCRCRRNLRNEQWVWVVKAVWYDPQWEYNSQFAHGPPPASVIKSAPTQYYCQPCGDARIKRYKLPQGPGSAVRMNINTGEVVHVW